jgi:hypothetical protein
LTVAAADPRGESLPLWRAIAGFAVLGGLVLVLLSLGPVYLNNDRFTRRVRAVVANNAAATDDSLRTAVLKEARSLQIPVQPGDVKISHPSGKLEVQLGYKVQKNLGLYRVDLHFHPSAKAK